MSEISKGIIVLLGLAYLIIWGTLTIIFTLKGIIKEFKQNRRKK